MSETRSVPRALVVYESMFGNTRKVAEAVAAGLRSKEYDASTIDVQWAPPGDALDVDLLVVGAPTHAFSLSRPNTRADAVRQGAPALQASTGLREWLATLDRSGVGSRAEPPPVAVFDTRVTKVRRLPTAAGRTAAKLVRRRGFAVLGRTRAFLVDDLRGPLQEGETERAFAWGQELADAAGAQSAPEDARRA